MYRRRGWVMLTVGNMHLLDLAREVKKGIEETGKANPFIFNTIGISDAISMGTEGMRSSLPSRDIIADSIECVMRGQLYDSNISLVPPCNSKLIVAWVRQEHGIFAVVLEMLT
jgi:dihydroxy-acid dehydratase